MIKLFFNSWGGSSNFVSVHINVLQGAPQAKIDLSLMLDGVPLAIPSDGTISTKNGPSQAKTIEYIPRDMGCGNCADGSQ